MAIEIFKFLNGLFQQIMNEVFQVKSLAPYYLRDKNQLDCRVSLVYGPQKQVNSALRIEKP